MANTHRRRIDPEDELCIDYTPSYPLPTLPRPEQSPYAGMLTILRADLVRMTAALAAGEVSTGRPYSEAIMIVSRQIATLEALQ